MIVEIINPNGKVSYTRPHGHQDVQEALTTDGYSVRLESREALDLILDLETQLLTAKFVITQQSGEIIALRPKSAPCTFSEVQTIMDEIKNNR